tara:strand:+ start:171 stop:905 length:735 start_codon:yes stop_codon:yes gene_type:complete
MIFNLFKSKPTLEELIPEGFVDIHSHILPGIDDGAKNVEESLKLISELKKLGFSKFIVTPHTYPGLYDNTENTISKSYGLLTSSDENLKNEVFYASEYLLENSLIKKIKENKLLCLKNNYVLVEMSYHSRPINLYEILFEIKTNGYIPVLAHPERYMFMHNKIEKYYELKKIGCKFQLNLFSITGLYGNSIVKFSDKLLKLDLIDFVGTDIHRLEQIKNFNRNIKIKNTKVLNLAIQNTEEIFR